MPIIGGDFDQEELAKALDHQARGSQPAALAVLDQALTLAEPEGYVRLFLDEGPPMLALLRAAPAADAGRSEAAGEAVRRLAERLLARHDDRARAARGGRRSR